MQTRPVPMTKDQLLDVLDDLRARVASGDSFRGHVEYLMPYDTASGDFLVEAAYRTGDLQGHGGMRLVGKLR